MKQPELCQGRFKLDIRGNFFIKGLSNPGPDCQGECSKHLWMWHLGTWFEGEHGAVGLTLEFYDPVGLFQP